jgi:hypothetical protein
MCEDIFYLPCILVRGAVVEKPGKFNLGFTSNWDRYGPEGDAAKTFREEDQHKFVRSVKWFGR